MRVGGGEAQSSDLESNKDKSVGVDDLRSKDHG